MIKKNFIIILLFFVVSLTACGGDTSSKVAGGSKLDPRIVFGVVQKGPAIEGSVVLVYELDSKAERTGKKLHTTTSGKQGSFGFKLPSSWGEAVEVVFSGRYFNEVTGDISTDTVSLSTIVLLQDAAQVSANINVLNTMVAARVRSLLRKSKLSFHEAVLSASTSIKNITGISAQRANAVDITRGGSAEDSAVVLFFSGVVIDLAKKYHKPTQQVINQLASSFAIDGQLSGVAEVWETRLKDLALNREKIYIDKYSSRLSRYLDVTAQVPTSASLPDALTLTSRPVAKIEANLSVEPNSTVILDGSKSESTNNKSVNFAWFQTDHGKERLELKNRFESKVSFDAPNKENITMQLTLILTDSDGMTGSKTVQVTTAKFKPSIDDFISADKEGSPVKNTVFVNEGSVVNTKLQVNNPIGGEISYRLNSAPSYGEVLFPFVDAERLSKSGKHSVNVSYRHHGSEENADTFVLEIVDKLGNIGTLRIDVIISPVNDPPNARDDLFRVTAGETLEGNVLDDNSNGADFDEEGDELSISTVTERGFSLGSNGAFIYTSSENIGEEGITEIFSYELSDGNGGKDNATVTITVTPTPNNAPVANDDTFVVAKNKSITIDVLNNDTDSDGDTLAFEGFSQQPTLGDVVINGDLLTYTSRGEAGSDEFVYIINDGRSGQDSATVSITIETTNHKPTAVITGLPESIYEGAVLTLDASTSSSQNGSIILYRWTYPSGSTEEGTNLSVSYEALSLSDTDVSRDLTFKLQVKDISGEWSDEVEVVVTAYDLPNISFTPTDYFVIEGTSSEGNLARTTNTPVGVVSIIVELSGNVIAGSGISVNYETIDGNSESFNDISGMLNFDSGAGTHSFDVQIIQDHNSETDEFFRYQLQGAINAEIVDNIATVYIIDDDSSPITKDPILTVETDVNNLSSPINLSISATDLVDGNYDDNYDGDLEIVSCTPTTLATDYINNGIDVDGLTNIVGNRVDFEYEGRSCFIEAVFTCTVVNDWGLSAESEVKISHNPRGVTIGPVGTGGLCL